MYCDCVAITSGLTLNAMNFCARSSFFVPFGIAHRLKSSPWPSHTILKFLPLFFTAS